MLLRDFFVGIVVFSLVIGICAVMAVQFDAEYGGDMIDGKYNATYNKLGELGQYSGEIKNATIAGDTTEKDAGEFFAFGVWNALLVFFSSTTLVFTGILPSIGADLGIPAWVMGGVGTMILINSIPGTWELVMGSNFFAT